MKRPSYTEAVQWIAREDDTEFMLSEGDPLSVTAALVIDIFDVDEEKFRRDLRQELDKMKS